MPRLLAASGLVAALSLLASTASAVPDQMAHQGRLHDALGAPLSGSHSLTFSIYDSASGGSPLWTETQASVDFDDGYFSVELTGLDAADFDGSDLYLGLAVDSGPEMATRLQLDTVPYAFRAATASAVAAGSVINASEIQVNGTTVIDSSGNIDFGSLSGLPTGLDDGADDDTLGALACSDGDVAVLSSGSWSCASVSGHSHDGGAITSGTVDISHLPVGSSSSTIAAGDHTHAGPTASTSCPDGEALVGFDGSFGAICRATSAGAERVFSRESRVPQFNYRNVSDQYYPELDVDFVTDNPSKLFIASTGTLRGVSGTCHDLERLLLDGQTLYRPYPFVTNQSRSWWAPRLAFAGATVDGGQHSVRLQVGDNHNDGPCGYNGDSQSYGRSRMAVLALPFDTPMQSDYNGSTALSPSWQDAFSDLSLDVTEDSDLVFFSQTAWHGNNHHTAGEAQARFRFSVDGTELGNDTTGEQSVSTYTEEWWRSTAMFGVADAPPGTHTVNLRAKVTTGAGSIIGGTHKSLVAFALPKGQVFYEESSLGPVSDSGGAGWQEIASMNFTMPGSGQRRALVMGSGVQSHPLSTGCHGAHRLEINGMALGHDTHGQGIIRAPVNGLEWAPFVDMSGVMTLDEGVQHTVRLLAQNSGSAGETCTWNGFGGGQARMLVIAPTD